MTKNELLLKIAIDCVQFNEGAEFELNEILNDTKYAPAIAEHYGFRWEDHKDDGDEVWSSTKDLILSEAVGFLQLLSDSEKSTEKPKTSNWYFLPFPKSKRFGIVPKHFWDKEKHLDDSTSIRDLEAEGIPFNNFHESQESIYEHNVSYEAGLKELKELGFEQVENPWEHDDDDDEEY